MKPPNEMPIHIDRKVYKVYDTSMTGSQLRLLPEPDISEAFDLFVEVPGGEDLLVEESPVELKPGMHFFSAPKVISPGVGSV
jgi:hypothetical protein